MAGWKPIATLIHREDCRDYLVATKGGAVRLLWWDSDDREWIPGNDREDNLSEDDVEYWYDLEPPPNAKKSHKRQNLTL